ncbi:hypothetical protein SAMN05661044_01361 [Olivibacter domesticus]|uniref:Uncharacterized protein n=2 Tax=Olivibacter domesticus TaxID=407022 RepID=A0A1H7KKF3_OLID1|nr:hypothetical protein SAMN05661044_01361 [Olivibacter domesticus]
MLKKRKYSILICLLITYFVVQAKEKKTCNPVSAFQISSIERIQLMGNQELPKEKDEDDWSTIRYHFFVRVVPTRSLPAQQVAVLAKYGE